ncbi:uncharacterized protein LOC144577814 [Callithrix jacchus]
MGSKIGGEEARNNLLKPVPFLLETFTERSPTNTLQEIICQRQRRSEPSSPHPVVLAQSTLHLQTPESGNRTKLPGGGTHALFRTPEQLQPPRLRPSVRRLRSGAGLGEVGQAATKGAGRRPEGPQRSCALLIELEWAGPVVRTTQELPSTQSELRLC